MNPLRQNLTHALLSLALLATMVSASGSDHRIEANRRILRMTHLAASAVCNLPGIDCLRGRSHRATPVGAVKQAVRELLQRDDR